MMKQNLKNPAVLALFAVCMLNGAAWGMEQKMLNRINVIKNHVNEEINNKQLVVNNTFNEENGVFLNNLYMADDLKKVFINAIDTKNITHHIPAIKKIIKNDKSLIKHFAKFIIEDNLIDCRDLINFIVKNDASLIGNFATLIIMYHFDGDLITEDNIAFCYLEKFRHIIRRHTFLTDYFAQLINDDNIKDCAKVIYEIIQVNPALAKIFAQLITKDNIKNCTAVLYNLVKFDQSLISHFASVINETNIKDCSGIIYHLMSIDKSLTEHFISLINENNIHDCSSIIYELVKRDKALAQQFAKLINDTNIHNCCDVMYYLIEAEKSLAQQFAQLITEKNLFSIPSETLILLATADMQVKTYIEQIKEFDKKVFFTGQLDHEPIEIALYAPEQMEKHMRRKQLGEIFNTQRISTLDILGRPTKKGASWQHFVQNYVDIIKKFAEQLKDKQLTQALFKLIKREWMEQEKGRYVLYHAQKMDTAYCNMIYTRLLELYYGPPIDKESWFAPRCNMPGKNLSYELLSDLISFGRTKSNERAHLQFGNAPLFGNTCKLGSCSFGYLATNSNVGSFKFTPEELFKQFNLEKYAKKYQYVFDKVEKLVKQCKKGTMLMYSFTKEALDQFTYATPSSGGYKQSMKYGQYQLMINGKNAIDAPTHEIIDTLRNNPEHFDKQGFKKELNYSDAHEYVIVITDDHPNDETKLGSANPFNQDMRCYHVHVEPQAYLIEKILDQLFEKIKEDIKKDKTVFVQKEAQVRSSL